MIPGEIQVQAGEIELNAGRRTVTLKVSNTGDRPIQFGRKAAYGYRLDIAAGTAVRFEPGQTRAVELVALDGAREVYGFQGKVMGELRGKHQGRPK